MVDKEGKVSTPKASSTKSRLETNIIKQVLETTVPVKIGDLLENLSQLKVAIAHGNSTKEESSKEVEKTGKDNNSIFTIGMRRTSTVVEMEIMES